MTENHPRRETSSTRLPVLIVGAGPTGLVLALWLTRLGVTVRIIDKTAEAGTTSRALAVQSRTLEFYRQMKFAHSLVEGGVKIAGVNLWVRGARAARAPLQKIGEGLTPFPFALVFPQDAHERLLVGRLDVLGVKVERETELVRFDQDAARVRAVLKRPDGTDETCEAAYLAGCDGARSTVREGLRIGFPGGTYAGLFYVADVTASGPPTDFELHLDLDEADLLIVFPLKEKGCIRLVGNVREEPGGADRPLNFEDVSPRAIEHLKLTISKVNWFSTYRVHHRVANSFRGGRAYLLGDAAHIHSPVGGQGMNTGIGDAVNLAWKLAAVVNGSARDSLLDTYEPERIGFARQLVATTDRVFSAVTKQGRFAQWVRTRLVPVIAPLLLRMHPVRRLLFRTVSQTGIRYPKSSLSEGAAGPLRGGDRLPWVVTGPDEDNFTALESVAWQVHVYGEMDHAVADACAGLHLPIHAFAWTPEMIQSGLVRGAVYLVRPDGYIALADPAGDPERLRGYFTGRGLTVSLPIGRVAAT